MAEGVLMNIATSVLQQLSSPALEEFLSLWNFKKELEKLKVTVETINGVLQDAEKKQSKEHLVQQWLAKLRVVMYDADDLFDTVAAKALRKEAMVGNAFKKEVRLFFSKSNQLIFIFKTAHEVKAIRERLDDIAKNMEQFKFVSNQFGDQQLQMLAREETHSFVQKNDVIGRDQDKEEIIKLLLPEGHRGKDSYQQKLSVIAIIGFGGLGKTTLAQFVYNDERVQKGFDLCLWACINYFKNLKEVLMGIINSVVGSKPDDNNLDQLQKELRGNLTGKKYLLVLDDVWDENADNWHNLKNLLDCGENGSKVLVTTRSIKVAQRLDALEPYFHLNVMSEESAWSLFSKMAFKKGELDENPQLEPLGRQIVQKCGYVPLALVTIGRMLRYKEKEKIIWLRFVEKEVSEIVSDNDDNKIMQTLKISYDDLPIMLKHCFAYCSLFPKDHIFEKSKLVQLWHAQGFIVPHPNQSFEEAGEKYFCSLIDRCFFQVVSSEYDIRKGCCVYTCKMHNLIHDLARHVAGLESKCFIGEAPSGIGQGSTLRHISVIDTLTSSSLDYSSLLPHSKTLRTLLCGVDINVGTLNMILGRFHLLRILSLKILNVEKMPDSIGELIHLRYLNLSGSKVRVLPNSICKLYHLQTLILKRCIFLKELPSKIGKLISLRHLFLEECDHLTSLPPGLAALTALVTLDRLIVHHHSGGLRYLDQLKGLCGTMRVELPTVGWLNAVEDARKSNMSGKQRLNGMILKWWESGISGAPKMADNELKAVIEALKPHDNLQYLKISSYGGSTCPSWVFSLKNVRKLHLENFTLEYLDDRVRFDLLLPSLEILKIKSMPNLKGWWKQVAAGGDHGRLSLPYLSHVKEIVIEECPMLTECMPLFGRTEKLILYGVDEKLVRELLIGNTTDTNCSSSLSSSSSTCHYNNRLKELVLERVKGLPCLPKDWIAHLTALQRLEIRDCKELSLSWTTIANMRIQSLRLWRVHKVVIIDEMEGEQQIPFKSLDELFIGSSNEGEWIQHHIPWKLFSSVTSLTFDETNLESLPDGIQHLTSLRKLSIIGCKQIRALPSWMVNLTSLQDLSIVNCSPELKKRCEAGTGEDWHLISHIRDKHIWSGLWFARLIAMKSARG